MIKVIIFDLDGVLVNTKDIHFYSLNYALKKNKFNEISYEKHLKIFDGLPTAQKLNILSKKYKITKKNRIKIEKDKKKKTSEILKKKLNIIKKFIIFFIVYQKNIKLL